MTAPHAVVIGAGLSGLTSSYELIQKGWRVTLLESSPTVGGLAASTQIDGKSVEHFYHFICRADKNLIDFVDELGLCDRLHWKRTRTSFFHDGQLYPFGTPFDLINFSAIPWFQRIRFGLHIMYSRYRSVWRWLDKIPAQPWLIENIGEQAYDVIWHPLLRIKFGEFYDKISAAWVWHRIWRVAKSRRRIWERESFGYLENGTSTLVDELVSTLSSSPNFQLQLNTSAKSIRIQNDQIESVITAEGEINCDAVISTIALPQLLDLLPSVVKSGTFFADLENIGYIGVVCALFSLRKPFSDSYWMNINDARISFNGIIEQTNLNQNLSNTGQNLIYVPFYLPTDQDRYLLSDDDLMDEYLPMLKLVNPDFEQDWIIDYKIFRNPYAQAICTTGFAEMVPDIRTPISGLYITDSTQFYPEDRTISAAIQQGRQSAILLLEDLDGVG